MWWNKYVIISSDLGSSSMQILIERLILLWIKIFTVACICPMLLSMKVIKQLPRNTNVMMFS